MSIKRIGVAAFVAMVVPLGALSAAWACTAQPQVFSVTPLLATAGSEVTMRGEAAAVHAPVEVRWNGVSGPKLAAATVDANGSFALTFTVPDVSAGIYSLVVVTGDDAAAVGRTAFEVTAAHGTVPADTTVALQGFSQTADVAGLDSRAAVGSSVPLMVGVGLLAFGGAALFAGFTLASLGRRRALATYSSR